MPRPNGDPIGRIRVIDLLVKYIDLCPAASAVFDEAEMEDRIKAHQDRVALELERLKHKPRAHRGSKVYNAKSKVTLLPDWLHICNCFNCRSALISENQPEMPTQIGTALAKKLFTMPKVAGRIDGRPACSSCLPSAQRKAA